MFGILNINKPAGVTSRDVVNHVQRIVRSKKVKVGHAGTLDPLATGVLVVCVGPATRLIEFVQQSEKTYRGTFSLGRTSDTEDVEGKVVELVDPPEPSIEQIENVLPTFVGEIDQRPPAYSALKVDGKRAYKLAREGKTVELKSRKIVIERIELVAYDYPRMVIEVTCGSGTYMRSLGRDIAESLGSGAVMSALVRNGVGAFRLSDACEMDELNADTIASHSQPALSAVRNLSSVELDEAEIRRISHGMSIQNSNEFSTDKIAAIDSNGKLVSILVRKDERDLRPIRNFVA